MKKSFVVYLIDKVETWVDSTDYYARGADHDTKTINNLEEIERFESEDDAISYIEEQSNSKYSYTILPVWE